MAQLAPADGPRFYVEVSDGELSGRRFEVGPDGLLVGRSPDCDLIFASPEISRRHCYLYPDGEACHVEDLGSRNGILVNGELAKKRRLADGDVVDLGASRLVLRVQRPEADPFAEIDQATRPGSALPTLRHPLAGASVAFGLLAYLHWGFGFCAVILAVLALREMRRGVERAGATMALGGLALGVVGGALNLWFAGAVPELREARIDDARIECRGRLKAIASAVEAHRAQHGGAYPHDLGQLVLEGRLERDELFCPGCRLHGVEPPRRYAYFAPDAAALGGGPDVLACDVGPDQHGGEGGMVLRRDGQVEWVPREQFVRLLRQLDVGPAAGAGP